MAVEVLITSTVNTVMPVINYFDKLFSSIMEGDFLMFETGSGKLQSILP